MGITYSNADEEVTTLADEVMRQYHDDLVKAGVAVGYMMAASERGPAVTLHGVARAATVRIVGLRDRAAGLPDAQVVIDAEQWKDAPDARRRALIDHELYHLEQKVGKLSGEPQYDDLGRPVLKMRPHDVDFGWFDAIAERHGDASYEVRQAKAFADKSGQTYFGWAEPPAIRPLAGKPGASTAGAAAAAELGDVLGNGGVESVTFSTGSGVRERSVTLTSKHFDKLKQASRKLRAGRSAQTDATDSATTANFDPSATLTLDELIAAPSA